MLTNYKSVENKDGSGPVLIDEDLFVYIVERYDGLSRMIELAENVSDRSSYLQRHFNDITKNGFDLLANQKTIEKIQKKAKNLNDLYSSTLVLLAGEITKILKEEAQTCLLDPVYQADRLPPAESSKIGDLHSISLPTIEQTQYDIDYTSQESVPCGAIRYKGVILSGRTPISVIVYPNETLQYTSLDGKSMKNHLALELQVHRYLMDAFYEDQEDFSQEEEDGMDIFMNFGKFEKRIGLSMNDEKEIYVINKAVDEQEWICLDDFIHKNGGILNMPLFYHTDAPLFIIRHWAKIILKIIHKVHDVSVVLRCLNTKQLYISRDGQRIKLGHTRGVGILGAKGNV